MSATTLQKYHHPLPLRALGFCGCDDSVHAEILHMISASYPFVEWGVLFRPDKEGQPRYATMEWVEKELHPEWRKGNGAMRLAAHLCGERVNEVLRGEGEFLTKLAELGFRRVQINATQVNGVDTEDLKGKAEVLRGLMGQFGFLEFIIQRSDEVREGGSAAIEASREEGVLW
jgi:hypothetical protein